jgi:hypothetical protein
MADKTNGGEVTAGMADAYLSVTFNGEANCTCSGATLTYTWYFGDGTSADGASVSHTYGANGAGNRSPSLSVTCNMCKSFTQQGGLSVTAIKGITVTQIGDIQNPASNGRLCFDAHRNVAGIAEPSGVSGSDKIDWYLYVTVQGMSLPNTAGSSFTLPAWPTYNGAWGANTLYVSIDGPHVAGQQGEMILTGTPSYVSSDKSIKVFYDGGDNDMQATGNTPNWYYYYTNALGNGPHTYSAGVNYGATQWSAPRNPPPVVVQIGANANDASPRWPAPCKYINNFANIVQHEQWHRSHRNHNYASHGNDGMVPNDPNDPDGDDVCSGGCQAGGWEQTCGTDADDDTTNGINDREWIAQQQETNADHSNVDWAHSGNQWE